MLFVVAIYEISQATVKRVYLTHDWADYVLSNAATYIFHFKVEDRVSWIYNTCNGWSIYLFENLGGAGGDFFFFCNFRLANAISKARQWLLWIDGHSCTYRESKIWEIFPSMCRPHSRLGIVAKRGCRKLNRKKWKVPWTFRNIQSRRTMEMDLGQY